MKVIRIFTSAMAALLVACVPASGADIVVGSGRQIADLETAESIVEDAGFVRVWVEPKGQSRSPRLELDDRIEAGFETRAPRGFGVSVVLTRADGRLVIMFGERNNRLSERGKVILNDLVTRTRQRFGDGVVVQGRS